MARKAQGTKWVVLCKCLLLVAIVAATGFRAYGKGQRITLTQAPHAGAGGADRTELISGTVMGFDFSACKIVIYAFAGGTWWVQPTAASPLTRIDGNGAWQTITHLGSTYAVLVVKNSNKPPATTADVPTAEGDVLAVKLVPGR